MYTRYSANAPPTELHSAPPPDTVSAHSSLGGSQGNLLQRYSSLQHRSRSKPPPIQIPAPNPYYADDDELTPRAYRSALTGLEENRGGESPATTSVDVISVSVENLKHAYLRQLIEDEAKIHVRNLSVQSLTRAAGQKQDDRRSSEKIKHAKSQENVSPSMDSRNAYTVAVYSDRDDPYGRSEKQPTTLQDHQFQTIQRSGASQSRSQSRDVRTVERRYRIEHHGSSPTLPIVPPADSTPAPLPPSQVHQEAPIPPAPPNMPIAHPQPHYQQMQQPYQAQQPPPQQQQQQQQYFDQLSQASAQYSSVGSSAARNKTAQYQSASSDTRRYMHTSNTYQQAQSTNQDRSFGSAGNNALQSSTTELDSIYKGNRGPYDQRPGQTLQYTNQRPGTSANVSYDFSRPNSSIGQFTQETLPPERVVYENQPELKAVDARASTPKPEPDIIGSVSALKDVFNEKAESQPPPEVHRVGKQWQPALAWEEPPRYSAYAPRQQSLPPRPQSPRSTHATQKPPNVQLQQRQVDLPSQAAANELRRKEIYQMELEKKLEETRLEKEYYERLLREQARELELQRAHQSPIPRISQAPTTYLQGSVLPSEKGPAKTAETGVSSHSQGRLMQGGTGGFTAHSYEEAIRQREHDISNLRHDLESVNIRNDEYIRSQQEKWSSEQHKQQEMLRQRLAEVPVSPGSAWNRKFLLPSGPPDASNEILTSKDVLSNEQYNIDFLSRVDRFIEKPEKRPEIHYLGKVWMPPPDTPWQAPRPKGRPVEWIPVDDKEHKWEPTLAEPEFKYESKNYTPTSSHRATPTLRQHAGPLPGQRPVSPYASSLQAPNTANTNLAYQSPPPQPSHEIAAPQDQNWNIQMRVVSPPSAVNPQRYSQMQQHNEPLQYNQLQQHQFQEQQMHQQSHQPPLDPGPTSNAPVSLGNEPTPPHPSTLPISDRDRLKVNIRNRISKFEKPEPGQMAQGNVSSQQRNSSFRVIGQPPPPSTYAATPRPRQYPQQQDAMESRAHYAYAPPNLSQVKAHTQPAGSAQSSESTIYSLEEEVMLNLPNGDLSHQGYHQHHSQYPPQRGGDRLQPPRMMSPETARRGEFSGTIIRDGHLPQRSPEPPSSPRPPIEGDPRLTKSILKQMHVQSRNATPRPKQTVSRGTPAPLKHDIVHRPIQVSSGSQQMSQVGQHLPPRMSPQPPPPPPPMPPSGSPVPASYGRHYQQPSPSYAYSSTLRR